MDQHSDQTTLLEFTSDEDGLRLEAGNILTTVAMVKAVLESSLLATQSPFQARDNVQTSSIQVS